MKRAGLKIAEQNLRFMNAKLFYFSWVAAGLPFLAIGAPYGNGNPTYQNSGYRTPAAMEDGRQLRASLSELNNSIRNHETEIRTFEETLKTYQSTLDDFREQINDAAQSQQNLIQAHTVQTESKLKNLDVPLQGVIADIRQLKEQANGSVSILGQYKQKLLELEKILEDQNQHMVNLETAIQSIMELIQSKENAQKAANSSVNPSISQSPSDKTYSVQSGDTLEKIARTHKVSVKALKEHNNLANDRIVIGQTLNIP